MLGIIKIKNYLLDLLIPAFPCGEHNGPAYFQYDHHKTTIVEHGKCVSVHIDWQIRGLSSDNYLNIVFGEVQNPELVESTQIPRQVIWYEFLVSTLFIYQYSLEDIVFIFLLYKSMQRLPYHWTLYGIRTFLIANYFSLKLRHIAKQYSSAHVLVYYNAVMLGTVSAFRRAGKDVWDVQHGLFGPSHSAYNNSRAFQRHSTFKPTYFLVWDSSFGEYLSSNLNVSWKSTDCRHLTEYRTSGSCPLKNKIILYSLQWETEVPEKVKNAVSVLKEFHWIFRKHPFESSDRSDLNWISEFSNADLTEADEPLASLLQRSCLHITYHSSVVFESAMLGVPSIILCNTDDPSYDPYAIFAEPLRAGMASIASQGNLVELIRTKHLISI